MNLEFNPKSCWEIYGKAEDRRAMDAMAKRYVAFLSTCKTERETVQYIVEQAEKAGFSPDFRTKACFRNFHGKTIFLARKGKRPLREGFRLIAAHADTPRLDLKQHPLYQDCELGMAKTHYYGGIRKHHWLARPLALHGVIVTVEGAVIPVRIGEDADDPAFTILDLLPHLAQQQMGQKLSDAFEAEKLNIVLGHSPAEAEENEKEGEDKTDKKIKRNILQILNERFGVVEEDLYSAELQMVPAGPARFVGLDRALIGGYGQDDRSCVFTALEAMLETREPEYPVIALFWDKEEIGSDGATGAKSLFLEYCVEDLAEAWAPDDKPSEIFMNSKALSADVSAAIDPDYQDLHEKLNAAKLGYGPCFNKFTGSRGKYGANDANPEYIGWLRKLFNAAGTPWQMTELGKVDKGGGGTVAKHLATYGMDVIDFGPAVLSMHSPFEITSKADIYATALAFKAFLEN
jgi:aspartyl aminopeptidase